MVSATMTNWLGQESGRPTDTPSDIRYFRSQTPRVIGDAADQETLAIERDVEFYDQLLARLRIRGDLIPADEALGQETFATD